MAQLKEKLQLIFQKINNKKVDIKIVRMIMDQKGTNMITITSTKAMIINMKVMTINIKGMITTMIMVKNNTNTARTVVIQSQNLQKTTK